MTQAETMVAAAGVGGAAVAAGTTPDEPTCEKCGGEMGWRDAAYVPAGERMCKRCYQRAERRALRGDFLPFTVPVITGGKRIQVARPGNRALRRQRRGAL